MSTCGCETTADRSGIAAKPELVERELVVDLYYIDIESCDRCQGASSSLRDALATVVQPLAAMGVTARLRETLVETAGQAEEAALLTSPSIRINGVDIQPDRGESACNACSALPNQSSVDCRVWSYRGEQFTSPPEGLIVEALMSAALASPAKAGTSEKYVMPANLKAFFQNKAGRARGCQ